ncbi:MAG: outer membrane beta-barrel protein [Bacteroides sp.]|jgi:hypothetical protein|nr:outer membrane beta-barrel protein [Bacteroides sp.]
MKRYILISAILVFSVTLVHGQYTSFGLKAGLNFKSLPSEQNGSTSDYIISAFSDSYTGYHVGGVAFFVFRGGFFQPELLYTQTGRDMRLEYIQPQQEDEYFTQMYSHLVLPLFGGAKFGSLKIGAGPVFSFLVNNWNDLGIEDDYQQELNKLTLGYHLGAGLELGNLMLDFKYEGNLTRFGEGITIGEETINFDTRPQQFILSLGLLF